MKACCLTVLTLAAAMSVVSMTVSTVSATKQDSANADRPDDRRLRGRKYKISRLDVKYAVERQDRIPEERPRAETLRQLEVTFGLLDSLYVHPRRGGTLVTMRIGAIPDEPGLYHESAVSLVSRVIVEHLNDWGLIGIEVDVGSQRNERDPEATDFTFKVSTFVAGGHRTYASGPRFSGSEKLLNREEHRRILERSPIQPAEPGEAQNADLLRLDVLNDYATRLSRHPGRRVDVAVATLDEDSPSFQIEETAAELVYLVQEQTPWRFYSTLSDTGTENTDIWRYGFGFVHNQLFGYDDVFRIDYSTAEFDESHALGISYEAPLPDTDRWRWRVAAALSKYDASDVGGVVPEFGGSLPQVTDFTGDSQKYDAQVICNLYQDGDFFFDLFAGLGLYEIHVENDTRLDLGGGFFSEDKQSGRETLLLPVVGARVEQTTITSGLHGRLWFEGPDLLTSRSSELVELGRRRPTEDWSVLRWSSRAAFFLEPLLDEDAWRDTSTPETSTLAHELVFKTRGQFAFARRRLIPNFLQVGGGLFSVRGYPESSAAGDSGLIANAEYQYHVPRDWEIEPDPEKTELFGQPFRWAPESVYGRPDWDLILRVFVDFGLFDVHKELDNERDETLLGTGIGAELRFKDDLSVRLDWGVALLGLDSGDADAGDYEFHFLMSWAF